MKKVLVALAIALAFVGTARADFVLGETEHLDVTSSHSVGTLLDYSTADVKQGGYIQNAYVYEDALLRIPEASIGWGTAYDSSTVDISGGSVSNSLTTYNTSSVNIPAGNVPFLYAYDNSSADISGGSVTDSLYAFGSSSVDVSSGNVYYLWVNNTSTVDISGGSVYCLPTYNTSTVDISGGSVDILHARDTSIVTFYGYDFQALNGLSLDGNRALGTGTLVGRWFDGTLWATIITTNESGAMILAIPEPATLGLLLLGGLALSRRRGSNAT